MKLLSFVECSQTIIIKKHPPNLDRLLKINDYKYMYNKRLQVWFSIYNHAVKFQ